MGARKEQGEGQEEQGAHVGARRRRRGGGGRAGECAAAGGCCGAMPGAEACVGEKNGWQSGRAAGIWLPADACCATSTAQRRRRSPFLDWCSWLARRPVRPAHTLCCCRALAALLRALQQEPTNSGPVSASKQVPRRLPLPTAPTASSRCTAFRRRRHQRSRRLPRPRRTLTPAPAAPPLPHSQAVMMERAWSQRTHEHVRQACDNGAAMIDTLARQSGEQRGLERERGEGTARGRASALHSSQASVTSICSLGSPLLPLWPCSPGVQRGARVSPGWEQRLAGAASLAVCGALKPTASANRPATAFRRRPHLQLPNLLRLGAAHRWGRGVPARLPPAAGAAAAAPPAQAVPNALPALPC